jgi:hypothetical protein
MYYVHSRSAPSQIKILGAPVHLLGAQLGSIRAKGECSNKLVESYVEAVLQAADEIPDTENAR